MAESRTHEKGPADYAREALSEWGRALQYGARAVAEKRREGDQERPPLKDRLNPANTDKGGKLGDVADIVLSRFGKLGKLTSKVSLGSRIVERLRDGSGAGEDADTAREAAGGGPDPAQVAGSNGASGGGMPIPIQESIDVAIPVRAAYAICTRFEEYPDFLDPVQSAEQIDDSHVTFVAKVRGRSRELEVEIVDERPEQRLDWECSQGVEHSGVISFHELAPRLTRLELTVELKPEGLFDRLTRAAHLTQRAIRDELHRFKAYGELWEEEDEDEPVAGEEPEEEEEAADAGSREDEIEGEEDLDEPEELQDEEDLEAEGDFEDEEYLEDEEDFEEEAELDEDEELEPARSGR